jgi:hypothetical protein
LTLKLTPIPAVVVSFEPLREKLNDSITSVFLCDGTGRRHVFHKLVEQRFDQQDSFRWLISIRKANRRTRSLPTRWLLAGEDIADCSDHGGTVLFSK